MSTDELYELALKELKEHRQVAAIWARALADSEGDKNKAVARYIKYRVEQVTDSFAPAAEPPRAPGIPRPNIATPPAAPAVARTATGHSTAVDAMQKGFDGTYAGAGHAPVAPPAGQGEALGFEMASPLPPAVPVAGNGWGRAGGTVSADPVLPMSRMPPPSPVPQPAPAISGATPYARRGGTPPVPPPAAPVSAPAVVPAMPQADPYAPPGIPEETNPYRVMPTAQNMPNDSALNPSGNAVVGFAAALLRAVARWFDLFVVSIPIVVTIHILAAGLTRFIPVELHAYMKGITQLVILFIATPIALTIDALIYAIFGNTLSKALLRIELYRDGRRLDGAEYFRRNVSIWAWAYAFGVGCINIFLQIVHCIMVSSSGATIYDQRLNVQVVCRPLDTGRILLAVAMFIALGCGGSLGV